MSVKKDEKSELLAEMILALEKIEGCKEFCSLIPEVRTNLVYAKKGAKTPEDVLAIDGRITVVNGMPHSSGRPKFGASSHMARLIIELNKFDPSIRAGINFASNPPLMKWLKNYCKLKGWIFGVIDRENEPTEVIEKEGASMPWKIAELVKSSGNKAPKIFYETEALGKEPLSMLVGKDPIEIAEQICEIARSYAQSFQPIPKIGKIDLESFEQFILKRLGKKDENVLVPPLTGVDAAVIDIDNDKVLIVAEDPIFTIPGQSLEMFGWYTVHIGASDVAVMGVKPKYMTYSLLMPPQTSEEDFRTIVNSIHKTALELEITIVGGHTGYYPVGAVPLIGGITVFSIADKDKYVTPLGAKPGDDVLLTKGPAIETVGILSFLYEKMLKKKYPSNLVEKAKSLCKQMTVVKDCLTAMEAGGVTSMHDATEGGVIGGLFEIANASKVGMEVNEKSFIYPEEVKFVCEELKIDQVAAIAEGSLLLTVKPTYSGKVLKKLKEAGIKASVIGEVLKDRKKRIMKRLDGKTVNLAIPKQDPFWPAFFKGLEQI